MPNISFEAAARVGASARAFLQQLTKEGSAQADGSASPEGKPSFGEMLLQRQQALSAGAGTAQVVLPEPLARVASPSPAPAEPGPVELNPILVSEIKLQAPARAADPQVAEGTATTATFVGPDGKTGNLFGHWEQRTATLRPFFWMAEQQLDADQREILDHWKQSPFNTVWVYDVKPSAENNWAGWGPPPRGWTARSDIPMVNGAYTGSGLPWPPPGEPPAR